MPAHLRRLRAGARDGVLRGPRGVRGGLRARLHRFEAAPRRARRVLHGLVAPADGARGMRPLRLGRGRGLRGRRVRGAAGDRHVEVGRRLQGDRHDPVRVGLRPELRRRDARDGRRDARGPHRGAPPGTHEVAGRMPARSIPLPPIHALRPRLRLHHGSQGVVERAFERLNSQRGSPGPYRLSLIRILECI